MQIWIFLLKLQSCARANWKRVRVVWQMLLKWSRRKNLTNVGKFFTLAVHCLLEARGFDCSLPSGTLSRCCGCLKSAVKSHSELDNVAKQKKIFMQTNTRWWDLLFEFVFLFLFFYLINLSSLIKKHNLKAFYELTSKEFSRCFKELPLHSKEKVSHITLLLTFLKGKTSSKTSKVWSKWKHLYIVNIFIPTSPKKKSMRKQQSTFHSAPRQLDATFQKHPNT